MHHAPRKPPNWSGPKLSGTQADFLIAALFAVLAAVIAGSIFWLRLHPESSPVTQRLLGLVGFFGLLGFLSLFYAAFIEPKMLRVRRFAVRLPSVKNVRIAVAADFHVGPFKGSQWVSHVVHKINSLKPDLVLLPGDFLFDEDASMTDLNPLKELRAPLGVFAVAGNHDAGHYVSSGNEWVQKPDRTGELEKFLKKLGIPMLRNTHVMLDYEDQKIALAGIDDLWGESCDLDEALKGIPSDLPTILLTHHPDTMLEESSKKTDLMICGHTHGGQVCWPGGRPLGGIPSVVGNAYAQGLFALSEKTSLFVSRGCGETLLRVRFCCAPEIALLEVQG
jgi:uncharacterized protein